MTPRNAENDTMYRSAQEDYTRPGPRLSMISRINYLARTWRAVLYRHLDTSLSRTLVPRRGHEHRRRHWPSGRGYTRRKLMTRLGL